MRLNHRALGISTILLSLWLLVLPPVSAAGTRGNSSDAGVPPTIPGLVPGKANASVAVSVILSEAPALAAPAASPVSTRPRAHTASPGLGIPGFACSVPGGFPKGVTPSQGAPVTTRKVIAARYCCDDTSDIFLGLPACSNLGDPRGVGNGHGTHVAGIAAGNHHTNAGPAWGDVALSGEAPAAWPRASTGLHHRP